MMWPLIPLLVAVLLMAPLLAAAQSNVHGVMKKPQGEPREIPCHLNQQIVNDRTNMRTCLYSCQDGNKESATTEKQFFCPRTVFRRGN